MSVTWLGLTFGDDGTGYVFPSYASLRAAASNYWRTLTNVPNLNTLPGSFFGNMVDFGTSVLQAAVQGAADAAAKAIFTSAEGVSLDQLLSPVTIRLPAVASTAVVYAYGAPGANVPLGSIVRTSPTSTAFTFDAGATIPLVINTEAWVFEVDVFAAGGAVGVTFTLTVDGTPFVFNAGGGDSSTDLITDLITQINASANPQTAYYAGIRPDGSRIGGIVIADVSGVAFLTTFVDSGPSIVDAYGAQPDTVTCSITGPIQAAAASLRFGQGFANIEGYTNPAAAVVGRDQETDSQLRARHIITQRQGGGNPDAIRSALLIPVEQGGAGATYASVEYNPNNITDAVGNVPHSIRAIVDNDADTALVAAIIWATKAAGDDMNGSVVTAVLDSEGKSQQILFDRLETIYIWSDVEVTPGDTWPITGDPLSQIISDVTDFVNALGGGKSVKPNDAPVSFFPNGTPRGVDNFTIRFGYSTDPLGIAPPVAYFPAWPDPQADASLATIVITGRQVAEVSPVVGAVTAIIV